MDEIKKAPAGEGNDGEGEGESKENFWNEARARGRVAGERVGREWDRLSEEANAADLQVAVCAPRAAREGRISVDGAHCVSGGSGEQGQSEDAHQRALIHNRQEQPAGS